MQTVLAILSASWLGLLCAVSPCPLAANVAAVGVIARNAANPRRVAWNGLAYALGRVLAYVAIAAVERDAPVLLSGTFGVASVLPVLAVAFTIAFASSRTARMLDALAAFER